MNYSEYIFILYRERYKYDFYVVHLYRKRHKFKTI